jgi:hypothetical protein
MINYKETAGGQSARDSMCNGDVLGLACYQHNLETGCRGVLYVASARRNPDCCRVRVL